MHEFIKKKQISFNDLLDNKETIQDFINYLYLNKLEFSKTKLAQILKISQASLYRKIKMAKGE